MQTTLEEGPTQNSMTENKLPYGVHDLDPNVDYEGAPSERIRCFVQGCTEYVRRPTEDCPGDSCPVHGIRCHYSRSSPTYSYVDAIRNVIVDADTLGKRIIGHPFKYETDRLSYEKSEDTLTWNVFRSLMNTGCLGRLASDVLGLRYVDEPDLYLWGIRMSGDDFRPWDLLLNARTRFEKRLPVKRPKTEPDIALYLPGRYLLLIEAKFTSTNPYYVRGPRKDPKSLTFQELLDIYYDPSLAILNIENAKRQNRIPYQLWRNMVFAEWMAQQDSAATKAHHISLVREGYDTGSVADFTGLLNTGSEDRFSQVTWEAIYRWAKSQSPSHDHLCKYMETKTAGLKKAFQTS